MRERALAILAILAVAATLAIVFRDQVAQLTGHEVAAVIYGLMALMLVGGGYIGSRRAEFGRHWLRDAILWVAIIIALALAYPFIAPFIRVN